MTLGIRRVAVKTRTATTYTDYTIAPAPATASSVVYPAVGTTADTGAQAGNDLAGRPIWPALFITDLSVDPAGRAGDWQQGGKGITPQNVYGTWKGAVKTIDQTKNPYKVTITPDADPRTKNHWNLAGGDTPPGGFGQLGDEGYGAEVSWNVDDLGLTPGHSYHFQFMVHDGDQNKSGGDVGEGCAFIYIPSQTRATGINSFPEGSVKVYPNPFSTEIKVDLTGLGAEPVTIKIYDAIGSLIKQLDTIDPSTSISLGEENPKGVYVVQVKQGDKEDILRVVKQ